MFTSFFFSIIFSALLGTSDGYTSTYSLLQRKWSSPTFTSRPFLKNEKKVMSFLHTDDAFHEGVFFDPLEQSLHYFHMNKALHLKKDVDASRHILDVNFMDTKAWIAQYSADRKCFTLMEESFVHNTSTPTSIVHQFPVMSVFIDKDNQYVISVSSDGVVSRLHPDGSVQYFDIQEHVFCVRYLNTHLYFLTISGICVLDTLTMKKTLKTMVDWKSSPVSFSLYSLFPKKEFNALVAFADGSLERLTCVISTSTMCIDCVPYKRSSKTTVLDCYIDGYKYIYAQNDGSLVFGDSNTNERWYELSNMFCPTFFRRMKVSHQKIMLDAANNDNDCIDWFSPSASV
jgi:WD40 repeat protein